MACSFCSFVYRWRKKKVAAAKAGKAERNRSEENNKNFGVSGISAEEDGQGLAIYDYSRNSLNSGAKEHLYAVPSISEAQSHDRFDTDFKMPQSTPTCNLYAVTSILKEPGRDCFVSDFKTAPSVSTSYLHAIP